MGLDELKKQREARDLFRQRYADGERDFTGIDLRNIHRTHRCGGILNEINLSIANLQGTYIGGSMLIHADLTGANMEGTDLSSSYIINANLSGANLKEAKLRKTDLTEANLRGADLTEADLRGADLTGADLSGANLTKVKISEETIFYKTILPDRKPDEFHFRVIEGKELLKSYARGKKEFSRMIIYRADLSGANLEGIDLRRTKLKYVNLSGANLRFANLSGAKFIHCNLSHADMFCSIHESIRYIYSDLRGVQRRGVNENMSRYVEVNLEGGDIPGGEEPSWYYHVVRDDGEFISGPTNWLYPLEFDIPV